MDVHLQAAVTQQQDSSKDAEYACLYLAKLPRWTQKECSPGAPHGPIHKQEIESEIHKQTRDRE